MLAARQNLSQGPHTHTVAVEIPDNTAVTFLTRSL